MEREKNNIANESNIRFNGFGPTRLMRADNHPVRNPKRKV
jgi:hypothetical protein